VDFLRISRRVDDAANSSDWPKAIEAMTDIRHGQGENALLFQERVVVVEEGDQIRCMFDYMRGDDPAVELGRSDDFRIRPTIPDEVNSSTLSTLMECRSSFSINVAVSQ